MRECYETPLSGKVCSGISGKLYAGMSANFPPDFFVQKSLNEISGKLSSGITGKVWSGIVVNFAPEKVVRFAAERW